MKKKSIFRVCIYIIIFLFLTVSMYLIFAPSHTKGNVSLYTTLSMERESELQTFYVPNSSEGFSEENSVKETVGSKMQKYEISFSSSIKQLRLDLGSVNDNIISIESIEIWDGNKTCFWTGDQINNLINTGKINTNQLEIRRLEGQNLILMSTGDDPFLMLPLNELKQVSEFNVKYLVFACIAALIITFIVYRYVYLKDIYELIKSIFENRKLMFSLAVNDFKVKYAGSYFGIIWAFVQPICTIMVFWFVFQMGLKSSPVSNVPFALWLSAGLIPWFFFSDAWNSATNAFMEYSYLVKKVVFKIDILPIVKITSTVFVHLFFVVFLLCLFAVNGFMPQIRMIGIFYYMFAMICLVVSLSFITSSVVIFFKDLSQIMNIVLQFGMWLTPIMWTLDLLPNSLTKLFKLNPMFYIVNGYRACMIGGERIFPAIGETVYFWIFTGLIFLLGISLFRRLKVHFADVL